MRKILILFLLFFVTIQAEEFYRVVELSGAWKFEIGDNMNWSKTDFNDRYWESIKVPADWESEGFPGYDGYGWYRKEFELIEHNPNEIFYLRLGAIDDSDMTFVNGHLVGQTGGFPPDFYTGYRDFGAQREYKVPGEYFKKGKNVIAVRVYDDGGEGGLRFGDIELVKKSYGVKVLINLEGLWKFSIGDNKSWMNSEYDDSRWDKVIIPAFWESHGYEGYDGLAWYRKSFELDSNYTDQNLILILGKIDDRDETYLNGQLIGSTGDMKSIVPAFNHDHYSSVHDIEEFQHQTYDVEVNTVDYVTMRAYYMPKQYLNYDGRNTISVRVFDGYLDGGIYEGPLAIINREQFRNFLEYSREKRHKHKNNFDVQKFLDKIFKIKDEE